MKYRELYEVLNQRRNHNPNFRYTDYSGWKERPQTYLTLARPLWIIAEDHGTGYRFWITQSSRDMQVSYAKMTAQGNGPMQTLTVKYADVVDQVILRLDGRNFVEQAFHELKTSCHKAAWNTYKQEPDFERKKDTIRFSGYGCSYDTWSNVTRWELSDSMKSILRGAAHFETGGYNMYPVGLSELVG